MSVPVVLNELSCLDCPDSRETCASHLRAFAKVLVDLARLPRRVFLLSETRVGQLALGPFTLASFLGERDCRDSIRQVLAFANHSPLSGFSNFDFDGCECCVGEVLSQGLLAAHLLHTASVSFQSCPAWCDANIVCELHELRADGEVTSAKVLIPNLADSAQVPQHNQLLMRFRECDASSGAVVWESRLDWFPDLTFLRRVEDDLLAFPSASMILEQIIKRLFELQEVVNEWDPQVGLPNWRSKVTPDAVGRKKLCEFVDGEGEMRIYDWHARYTPGAGRIHFRLIPERRCIEIAYIGTKLGA